MVQWESLIRFRATDGNVYWSAIALEATPATGVTVQGFPSIEALESDGQSTQVTVEQVCHRPNSTLQRTGKTRLTNGQLLAPVPATGINTICIGLNYRNHANEASVRRKLSSI